MKLLALTILLLVGLAASAPAQSEEDEKVVVTKEFYPKSMIKYKSDHDIVSIVVPLNSLNFDEDETESPSSEDDDDITFFFIEADVDADGKRTYQGLYVFNKDKAAKILDNGQAAAASSDNSTKAFLGATDGLYVYRKETNDAVKYGSLTDNIIDMAVQNTSEYIYILTADHELYKVTDEGNTKTKVEGVDNAQQIVLDYSNNLYFYGEDKKPYVLTADGVKAIEGVPANPSKVDLVKPPFIIDDGVPFIVDTASYILYANGTSELTDFEFKPKAKPTAYGMESTLIMYFGYNKNIYEYNLIVMLLGDVMEQLKDYLEDKTSSIRSLASKPRRANKNA